MRYATTPDGLRVEAMPGQRAQCPHCGGEVLAKCGQVNVWHWAHRVFDCDTWSEPMSQWHIDWQSMFDPTAREVTIGAHRADIKLDTHVIEFQQSHLSGEEIRAREDHYGPMVWVFNAIEAYDQDRLNLRTRRGYGPLDRTFRWKHPRKSLKHCRSRVFLDIGIDSMLEITFFPLVEPPYGGAGKLYSVDMFLDEMLGVLA